MSSSGVELAFLRSRCAQEADGESVPQKSSSLVCLLCCRFCLATRHPSRRQALNWRRHVVRLSSWQVWALVVVELWWLHWWQMLRRWWLRGPFPDFNLLRTVAVAVRFATASSTQPTLAITRIAVHQKQEQPWLSRSDFSPFWIVAALLSEP